MDEQMIVNQAVDKYHRLDKILRSQMLKDEDAAFLRGRRFELMMLIYTFDEQAIMQLPESPLDAQPETVSISRLREINSN